MRTDRKRLPVALRNDTFKRFRVEQILDGEILPTTLGIVTVTALKGEAYSECKVSKKEGKAIYENFNANKQIKCFLIIK